MRTLTLYLAIITLAAVPTVAAPPEFAPVRSILSEQCVDCHNATTTEGGFNLERFDSLDSTLRDRAAWKRVFDVVEAGQMPLRLELRATPIRVSLIQPGPIATRFNENAIAQFERWIDPVSSPWAATLSDIAARYRKGGGGLARYTLPPSAVTARVVHAFESPRPRARYKVTTPTWGAAVLRRLAPRAVMDALMARN